jgi:hypothetical protein
MRDASFAEQVLGKRAREADAPEDERPWRNGFSQDSAANTFSLSLRAKDGRSLDGFSMSLYKRHRWLDGGGRMERLVLIFSEGGVLVEGYHFMRDVEALLEEGKLKRIQEHNSSEIAAIRHYNLTHAEKQAVVVRIVVSPSIETVLESDESLAEIAKAVKGESASETGHAGNTH